MNFLLRSPLLLPIALAALLCTACTVGPNYPGAPDAAPLSTKAAAFRRADAQQTPAALPPARWWEALNDPELTRLVDSALAHSPTLRAARARILEARAALAKQRAAGDPSATATAAAIKARVPAGGLSSLAGGGSSSQGSAQGSSGSSSASSTPSGHETLDFYTIGFDALWELDIFGGNRRAVESARARTEAAAAQHEDAQVQLAAEVGQAYASLRGLQEQLAIAQHNSQLEQQMLQLTELRRRGGTADDLDVERMRSQITRTQADIVPLQGRIEEALDQLALLTGQEPGTLDAELTPAAALPELPASVPVGDPAALLRRRPDVRAAERSLAASNAAIGQAVAQLFPTVTLFGNIGYSSQQFSNLLDKNKLALVGGPLLRWNFLNFGSTRAQIRQANASNQEALANYDQAVLAALQDAESSLSRFRHQRDNVVQLGISRDAAARTAALAQKRYGGGTASLIDALDAERQRLQADQSVSQARAELLRDYVALQKSLGLGWQPAPVDDDDDKRKGAARAG